MPWRRRGLQHPMHLRKFLGFLLVVAGVLLMLLATPGWLWLTLLGALAAWCGWQLLAHQL